MVVLAEGDSSPGVHAGLAGHNTAAPNSPIPPPLFVAAAAGWGNLSGAIGRLAQPVLNHGPKTACGGKGA